jgi:hypothetical protein
MAAEPAPDGGDWFRADEGKKEKAPAEDEFAELYGTDAMYDLLFTPIFLAQSQRLQ